MVLPSCCLSFSQPRVVGKLQDILVKYIVRVSGRRLTAPGVGCSTNCYRVKETCVPSRRCSTVGAADGGLPVGIGPGRLRQRAARGTGACLCVWYIWNFRRADYAFVYRAVHLFMISILSCVNPVWLLAAAKDRAEHMVRATVWGQTSLLKTTCRRVCPSPKHSCLRHQGRLPYQGSDEKSAVSTRGKQKYSLPSWRIPVGGSSPDVGVPEKLHDIITQPS